MNRKMFPLAFSALLVFVTGAFTLPSVIFNAETGVGFVGKGDVQLALGWNNAQLQANAGSLTFTYSAADTYTSECTFSTTTGGKSGNTTRWHVSERTRSATVNKSVEYAPRSRNQVTGFILSGFGSVSETGDELPVLGAFCQGGNDGTGTWTSVTLTSSTGGLSVNGVVLAY